MFNWAKATLANVAGTAEPIYGPEALKSVAVEAEKTPHAHTELERTDLKWLAMDSTSVENQIFYFFADNGYIAFCQVIYSNVAGIRTTAQFNCKIFHPDPAVPPYWSAAPLSNTDFSEDKNSFYADDLALELSEDGTSYTIKSLNDAGSIVDLKVTRVSPGFQAGKTGHTLYGTDPADPWGAMRHAFWPRCTAEGTITTKQGAIDFKGSSMFIHALQGMKPHHAAARWNFVNFQGPTYSAIMMEFTTPPSYGSTVVNVSAIVKGSEIVYAGCNGTATHLQSVQDSENDWPEPSHVKYTWSGTTKDGKPVEAVVEGSLGTRTDRVDIMAEVPGFVKKLVSGAVGTRPYIYQFHPDLPLKLKIGDEEIIEQGTIYTEATFISE
ncbi:hypothetical protein G7046_g3529 [Stylonectria norvegica]|nr:hypothetical protein G7046_g3529 [Stylonectria norvegica]